MPMSLRTYDTMVEKMTEAERAAVRVYVLSGLAAEDGAALERLVDRRRLPWIGEEGMWDLVFQLAVIAAEDRERQRKRAAQAAANGHRQGYGGQWR